MAAAHSSRRRTVTLVGLGLLLPGLLFVAGNLLVYELGVSSLARPVETVFHPKPLAQKALVNVLVVGGPLGAVLLSTLSVVRFRGRRDEATLEASVSIRLDPFPIVVGILGLVVLGAMALYLVVENLPCLTGSRASC